MNIAKFLLLLIVSSFAVVGCEADDGPAENAGEALDDAAGEASDAMEDACEEIQDGTDAESMDC